jgi:hypothetical protein
MFWRLLHTFGQKPGKDNTTRQGVFRLQVVLWTLWTLVVVVVGYANQWARRHARPTPNQQTWAGDSLSRSGNTRAGGYDGHRDARRAVAVRERRISVIRRSQTMDIIYVGVVLLFFALSWGLVRLCERL